MDGNQFLNKMATASAVVSAESQLVTSTTTTTTTSSPATTTTVSGSDFGLTASANLQLHAAVPSPMETNEHVHIAQSSASMSAQTGIASSFTERVDSASIDDLLSPILGVPFDGGPFVTASEFSDGDCSPMDLCETYMEGDPDSSSDEEISAEEEQLRRDLADMPNPSERRTAQQNKRATRKWLLHVRLGQEERSRDKAIEMGLQMDGKNAAQRQAPDNINQNIRERSASGKRKATKALEATSTTVMNSGIVGTDAHHTKKGKKEADSSAAVDDTTKIAVIAKAARLRDAARIEASGKTATRTVTARAVTRAVSAAWAAAAAASGITNTNTTTAASAAVSAPPPKNDSCPTDDGFVKVSKQKKKDGAIKQLKSTKAVEKPQKMPPPALNRKKMVAKLAKRRLLAKSNSRPLSINEIEEESESDTPAITENTSEEVANVQPSDTEATSANRKANEMMTSSNASPATSATPAKRKRPPPITVLTTEHAALRQTLTEGNIGFELRVSNGAVKIYTNTEDDHIAVERLLDVLGSEYITHAFKSGPKIKMILKGIPREVPTDVILKKLEADGLKPIEVRPVPAGNGYGIFAVDFPKGNTTVEDLQASHRGFAGYRGGWSLAPVKKISNSMCRKCCGYGHMEKGCHINKICYACAEGHYAWECDKLEAAADGRSPASTSSNPNPVWRWRCINCYRNSSKKFPLDFHHMATDPECTFKLATRERTKNAEAAKLAAKNQRIQEAKEKALAATVAAKKDWPELRSAMAASASTLPANLSVRRTEPVLREPSAIRSASRRTVAVPVDSSPWINNNPSPRRARSRARRGVSQGTQASHATLPASNSLLDPLVILDIVSDFITKLESCRTVLDQLRAITEMMRAVIQNQPSHSQ